MTNNTMKHILSLDVGTTSLKGVLFDLNGKVIGSHLYEYDLIRIAPDIVELDPETYWQAAISVIRSLLTASGIAASEIASVGITSQGETLIALDGEGRPLRRAIVWLDNRSGQEADEIAARFALDDVYRVTGQQEIVPTWTATRILWLRKKEPEVFAATEHYLLVEDYLIFRLTGRFVTDHALNPSTLYYDLTTNRWWPEMLEFLEIKIAQLPELKYSGEIAGHVTLDASSETGLSTDTVVTTSPIDQVAGAVGAGNLEPGTITETTGAAMAICATVDRPLYDPLKRVGLYLHSGKGNYVLMPWVPTAGMVFRWFRDELGGSAGYDELVAEAADVGPGADGLILLPHLSGAGSPEMNPSARGVFWGMTLSHRRGHFVRAILEAVAFMLRRNLEMLQELGAEINEIRCLGGAAKSDIWLQIKADVCRKELLVMDCEESTSLGTAMLSAVGTGRFESLQEASKSMVRVKRRVTWCPTRADEYDKVYQRYLNVNENAKSCY